MHALDAGQEIADATLLDAPKLLTRPRSKSSRSVERGPPLRRLLDFFLAGLCLAVVSLAFLLGTARGSIRRDSLGPAGQSSSVTPPAAGFFYFTLFRRRAQDQSIFRRSPGRAETVPSQELPGDLGDFEEDNHWLHSHRDRSKGRPRPGGGPEPGH